MQYRDSKNKEPLSILGFGCMRFPKKGGTSDIDEVEHLIMHAISEGVNYFDTAYIYGDSEVTLGKVLAKNNCREQVQIATKLPHYMLRKEEDIEKYFTEQLKRLQTDYIDYYLMHMLPDIQVWNRLVKLGILDFLKQKKEEGAIRKIGFSYHGNTAAFLELLDAYDWDMCQIQYNYMDEHSQAGRAGLKEAAQRNIPVVIMEPLRGGRLVNDLPNKALALFDKMPIKRSPAEWAFRWLWNQPEVTVILSGMNSMDMLEENIRVASQVQVGELTEEEMELFQGVKAAIDEKVKIPCTGCGYCMPCPKGVDIPGSFRCHNVSYTDNYSNGFREYLMCTTMRAKEKRSNASKCIECGKCEQHCPQGIEIRKELKNVKKRFESPVYKLVAWIIGFQYH